MTEYNNIELKLKTTRYGDMVYLPQDLYVGGALESYGEYSQAEVEIFDFVSQFGGAAIDCGANMGAHTVALARKYEHVFAFEPQLVLYRCLRANTAEWLNVTTYRAAVGSKDDIIRFPLMDYSGMNNYGGFGRDIPVAPDAQYWQCQQRQIDKVEAIRNYDKIGFIKIDVEGMEAEVIEGAMAMLDKHRPILYVENDKPKQSSKLVNLIYNLEYKAYWHITALFNPDNFNNKAEDIFPGLVSFNLICIPNGHQAIIHGLQECTPDDPYLPEGCHTAY